VCNAWNHDPGCTCGFGGEGHLGGGGWRGGSYSGSVASTATRQTAWSHWSIGHARTDLGEPFTHPTKCPVCGAAIFFHTNGNGDAVFFDDLGWPWPKHGCLSREDSIRRVPTLSNTDTFRELVEMVRVPTSMGSIREHAAISFSRRMVGNELVGVVLSVVSRKLRVKGERSLLSVFAVILHLSKRGGVVRLYLKRSSAIRVGDVAAAVPRELLTEHGRVLYALTYRVIKPPA